jgi:hypothetical protein
MCGLPHSPKKMQAPWRKGVCFCLLRYLLYFFASGMRYAFYTKNARRRRLLHRQMPGQFSVLSLTYCTLEATRKGPSKKRPVGLWWCRPLFYTKTKSKTPKTNFYRLSAYRQPIQIQVPIFLCLIQNFKAVAMCVVAGCGDCGDCLFFGEPSHICGACAHVQGSMQ